jgi:ABC-type uncharacterized transport system auxiliary subunit
MILPIVAAVALTACAPTARDVVPLRYYDFGPQAAATPPKIAAVLQVANVSAPEWLESTGIPYRAAYLDPKAVYSYVSARWLAPPNALLTTRLQVALGGSGGVVTSTDAIRAGCVLRVALEDFSQTFDSAQSSRVAVRARASLVANDGKALIAQQVFASERPAVADAAGAVNALGASGDELVAGIVAWLAATFDVSTPQGQAAIKQCKAS